MAVLLVAFLLAAAAPETASAVCVCGNGDGKPLVYSPAAPITIDGNVAEWGSATGGTGILGDEDNNVCDGPAGGLVDRDAPVQSTGRDIVQFSWTYDDAWLYFFTERAASTSNIQRFLYYADVDNDGWMEEGEPVIAAAWQGGNRQVDVYIATYDAIDNVNGDSMVDTQGFGDGYTLPGRLANIPGTPNYSGVWGVPGGLAMEFRVSWAALGFSGPIAHSLHVSSTNASLNAANLPTQIDDNLGGCGGGGGSTQYADLSFLYAYSLQGHRADTVWGLHHLVNLGNGGDAFALASSVSGTHVPSVSYYRDNGDGTFTAAADTPIASIVSLAVGASADILVVYGIGTAALPGIATVVTTATSQYDPLIFKRVTDTVLALLPELVVAKYVSSVSDAAGHTTVDKAIPDAVITYTVTSTNSGNSAANPDTVFLRDTVTAGTAMRVGDGVVSPIAFTAGSSGLTFTFTNLGSAADDIAFTSESGPAPAFTYTPVPDANLCDPAVRGFRINPKGSFGSLTSFSFTYGVRIE